MSTKRKEIGRCPWPSGDPLMTAYHDEEWGTPVHDDRKLFEFLVLGGAQAGLSWSTVLRKRENYRKAFSGFDPARVARYGERDVQRLLGNEGIIRNRRKIEAAVRNAKRLVAVQKEFGSFDAFLWGALKGRPVRHRFRRISDIPAVTGEAEALSRELKARGFAFVGPTICYAFMQAIGMVNDHLISCFRYRQVQEQRVPARAAGGQRA